MATHWTIGAEAADPHRLAAFWRSPSVTLPSPGYDDPDGASIVDPDGRGPAIGWLGVPEEKTAKNRVHIDIHVAGEPPWDWVERAKLIGAKVDDLLVAGATTVREEEYGDEAGSHDPRPRGHARSRAQRVLRRVVAVPQSPPIRCARTPR